MEMSSYSGPHALTHSKYANPSMRKASASHMTSQGLSAIPLTTSTVIATEDQVTATESSTDLEKTPTNSDAELAWARGKTLKEEVEQHSATFAGILSNVVVNTRRMLELIRKSMLEDGLQSTTALDDLWLELEQLFAAANDAKTALPHFLEKQRNNMSLYHNSRLNETIKDSQKAINIQHKKIQIQHDLILEHQEAFQAYKNKNVVEVEDFKEKVSRLTLEKGKSGLVSWSMAVVL